MMDLFWSTIFPALIAGGLAGQLATLFGGAYLTKQREHKKWLVSERYKLFSDLLTVVTRIPKEKDAKDRWTYEIRDISQRLHVLFKSGTAPDKLENAIESVFHMAKELKEGRSTGSWTTQQRNKVRTMRQEMSKCLDAD